MPRQPRKKKAEAAAAEPPAATLSKPRWRWVRHSDGSQVAERIEADPTSRAAEADWNSGEIPLLSTGAHMRGISSVLTEIAGLLHFEEAEFAPEILAQAWQQAVGDFLATQAELVSISQGTACIRTAHPAVRFELQRHKKDIIRALNQALGEDCVKKVILAHG